MLTTILGGGVVAAFIAGLFSRRKTQAETIKLIQETAQDQLKSMREQLRETEERQEKQEMRLEAQSVRLELQASRIETLEARDRKWGEVEQMYKDYVTRLRLHIMQGNPPPPPEAPDFPMFNEEEV